LKISQDLAKLWVRVVTSFLFTVDNARFLYYLVLVLHYITFGGSVTSKW